MNQILKEQPPEEGTGYAVQGFKGFQDAPDINSAAAKVAAAKAKVAEASRVIEARDREETEKAKNHARAHAAYMRQRDSCVC